MKWARFLRRPDLWLLLSLLTFGVAAVLALLGNYFSTIVFFVSIGCVLLSLLAFFRSERKKNSAVLAAIQQMQDMQVIQSKIAYRTEPVRNIAGSVGKLRHVQEEIRAELQAETQAIKETVRSGSGNPMDDSVWRGGMPGDTGEVEIFAPQAIRSVQVEKEDAAAVGRIAAAVGSDESSDRNLALALSGRGSSTRRIATVASNALSRSLESVAEVRTVIPGTRAFHQGTESYLIVEERATDSGPWSGFLDTQGTELFCALLEGMRKARNSGVMVVVVAESVVRHNSATLRDAADLVIDAGREVDAKYGIGVKLPVVDVLKAYTTRAMEER
ncbi:hypothetical protein [Corynebacterium meridianum]|uniref:Uncharacterized protein n=1 Tax=Corynebacterium meridianum TaxID=2765363 RepID=A0A934M9F3_9CORY|nr:hypothetical protein [Corynebacterium meridianum]MBI8990140.1 hypothetical protein [Corynebacterium meridianum]